MLKTPSEVQKRLTEFFQSSVLLNFPLSFKIVKQFFTRQSLALHSNYTLFQLELICLYYHYSRKNIWKMYGQCKNFSSFQKVCVTLAINYWYSEINACLVSSYFKLEAKNDNLEYHVYSSTRSQTANIGVYFVYSK